MSHNNAIPNHVGFIMDGNRRWAESQHLSTLEGHVQGQETLRTISEHAFKSGVSFVSAYVFSTENWRRSHEEVSYLMKLVYRGINKYLDEFHDAGIRLVFLGARNQLDKKILEAMEMAEEKTRHNAKGTLALCFNYGGKQEIVDATKKIIASEISQDEVTVDVMNANMYAPEIPPIDFLIRTSGEYRLSGFMLWRVEYSELYFVQKHWPAFSTADLDEAFMEYAHRKRRFGK